VLLATHIALVANRGNMARGQLIFKHNPPAGAPPPTLRGPPGMAPPDQYGDRRADYDARGGPDGEARDQTAWTRACSSMVRWKTLACNMLHRQAVSYCCQQVL